LLVAIAPVRVVSLLDAVADRVRASGIRRAAIFGTRLVMGTGAFDLLGSVELGGIVG
jgi:aspartate/glutamate racemase